MDQHIETIRSAVAEGADDAIRQAGAAACRAILAALEARQGEPLAPSAPPTEPSALPPPIAVAIGALRNVPPDKVLDLVIDRLRNVAAARGVELSPSADRRPFRVHHLPVPQLPKEAGKP